MAVKRKKLPIIILYVLAFYSILGITVVPASNQSNHITQTIKDSLIGTARAESQFFSTSYNGDACWNASFANNLVPCPTPPDESIDICMVENETTALPVYYYTSNDVINSYYSSTLINPLIGQSPLTGLTINPVYLSTITPYLTDFNRLNYQLDLTAPAVSFGSSPVLTTINVDGEFDVQGGTNALSHLVQANVRMEHINTGPTLTNLNTGPYSANLPSPSSTINIPVSVDYGDDESNLSNITFELSDDNFTTILQTQTYNNVAVGTINHNFSGLGVGDYQWRVNAVETNATGNCIGYPNEDPPINLSAQGGPEIFNLTSSGSSDISNNQLASTGQNKFTSAVLGLFSMIAGLVGILFSAKRPTKHN